MDDAEEQAQADEEAEAAAAEALVETTLEMVDAKKCGLCYEWFEAEQMRWDAEPYCYVCKDDEACTARRPGARGRKRARREGDREGIARRAETRARGVCQNVIEIGREGRARASGSGAPARPPQGSTSPS